jgi:hypothetical protein
VFEERALAQLLGEHVGWHVFGLDVTDGDDAAFLALSRVMVSEVDVLRSGALNRGCRS